MKKLYDFKCEIILLDNSQFFPLDLVTKWIRAYANYRFNNLPRAENVSSHLIQRQVSLNVFYYNLIRKKITTTSSFYLLLTKSEKFIDNPELSFQIKMYFEILNHFVFWSSKLFFEKNERKCHFDEYIRGNIQLHIAQFDVITNIIIVIES